MAINVIPVQGTFDIARGRNLLRTHMAANHWHPMLWARGAALLTAMGELILSTQTAYAIPIEVSLVNENRHQELSMRCSILLDNISTETLSTLEERIHRAADHVDINRHPNQMCIMACLYPAKEA